MPEPFPALDGVASSHGSTHVWGNLIGNKPSNIFHLCFQNIGGLLQSIESEQEIKLRSIHQSINNSQADAYAFTKHNTCWDLLAPNKGLPCLTQGWWENAHWSVSHNWLDKNNGVYQPGGISIVAVNKYSHNALQSGSDPLGLGRWSWVKLCGFHAHHMQLVSMYHPCKSSGPLSTYQQHLWAFGQLKWDFCPKKGILEDLATEI